MPSKGVRTYPTEFKSNAVARVVAGETQTAVARVVAGETQTAVAADLGIASQNVQRWVHEAGTSGSLDSLTPQQRRIFAQQDAAYKRDLTRLEAEITLLKKALMSGERMLLPDADV